MSNTEQTQGVPAGWKLATVSDGDIRIYGPDKESWLIRKDNGEGFYDFIHRFFAAMLSAAPQAQPVEAEQAENLRRDYARALDTIKGHAAQIGVLEQHIRELRAFQAMVNRHAPEFPDDPDGPRDVWYWQGDGRDHLESMTHQLPVVIRAEQLRELLAARPAQPVREPMSWDLFVAACEAEYGEEFCPNNLGDVSDEEKAELMRVVSIVERHHGIGSKGGAE